MAFKDLFVKSDDTQKHTQTQQAPANNQNAQAAVPTAPVINPSQISAPVVSAPAQQTAETDENIIKELWNVLIQKNLPGPDFLELKSSAAALESMGLPTEKRYEAAFKMLRASYPDFTKEVLLNSVETYKGYVTEELNTGLRECEEKKKATVGANQLLLSEKESRLEEIQSQISKLQAEYTEAQNEVLVIKQQITEASHKLEHDEAVFRNSIEQVLNTLEQDKQIMSTLNI